MQAAIYRHPKFIVTVSDGHNRRLYYNKTHGRRGILTLKTLIPMKVFKVLLVGLVLVGAMHFYRLPWNIKEFTFSAAKAPFGAVFYVNLDRRLDRQQAVTNEFSRSHLLKNIGVHRVSAYDGRVAPLHELVLNGYLSPAAYNSAMSSHAVLGEKMTTGALGCLMSHYRVWQKVVAANVPAIVFEDDVQLVPSFDHLLPAISQQLPSDWGMLYLANLVDSSAVLGAQSDYSSMLWKVSDKYWGTYAYAISPLAARRLLAEMFPMRWQADSFIMNTTRWFGISVFRSKINLVTTDNRNVRDTDVQVVADKHALIPRIHNHVKMVWQQNVNMESKKDLFAHNTRDAMKAAAELTSPVKSDHSTLSGVVERHHTIHMPALLRDFGLTVPTPAPAPHSVTHNLYSMLACLTIVYNHGGLCTTSKYVFMQPWERITSSILGFFSLSRTNELMFDIVGGAPQLQVFREIQYILRNMIEKTNREDLIDILENIRKSSGNQIVILPSHVFDPMPLHPSRKVNYDARKQYPAHSFAFRALQTGIDSYSNMMADPRWSIPRILHFIWVGNQSLPLKKAQFLRRWMKHHRDWQIMLWTDCEDCGIQSRVQDLATYRLIQSARSLAQKADIARYQIVHDYGGIYVDLDFDNFAPLDFVINDNHGFVCHENGLDQIHISLSNGLFGFAPCHPVMQRANSLIWHSRLNTPDVNMNTGPRFFRRAVGSDLDKIRVLPANAFYPVGYAERDRIMDIRCRGIKCRRQFPHSYAMHHWKRPAQGKPGGWDYSTFEGPSVPIRELGEEIDAHNNGVTKQRLRRQCQPKRDTLINAVSPISNGEAKHHTMLTSRIVAPPVDGLPRLSMPIVGQIVVICACYALLALRQPRWRNKTK
jgi:GR25 family glycosyltransferase involved in LPS biosynthesis